MGLFDKVAKTATNVGKSALDSVTKVSSSVGVAAQDNSELVALKAQVNVIDQELTASYAQVGRKYVEYVASTGDMPGIDVSDILKLIDPKLAQRDELQKQIIALEKKIKDNAILRERQAAESEYLSEKEKLDKALAMDIISQSEHDAKLAIVKKKMDNFEAIRKVEQQLEMSLITKEEYAVKIQDLTQ